MGRTKIRFMQFIIIAAVTIVMAAKTVYGEDNAGAGPDIDTPSAVLMESRTGQIIYEKNANESLAPASITKIMTLNLIFEALEDGRISLEDEVTVSEHAAGMGGSQVFLEVGEKQTVNTMIKCITVASANDACVAMAEHICGSEDVFVGKMNEKAKELGMNNTHFVNCCGLDDEGHTSSAQDVAIMSRELITKHPQIKDYSNIWMDTITHVTRKGESEFTLSNTNKLIKQYSYATGLKTGSTSKAGCCLSATAEKDGIELIAVVMAAPNSKTRFSDAVTLLNYGFSTCNIYVDDREESFEPITIKGGKESSLPIVRKDTFSYLFLNRYSEEDIRKELIMNKDIKVPVKAGDSVGMLNYYYKDTLIGTIDIVAGKNVDKMNFGDALKKIMLKFLN